MKKQIPQMAFINAEIIQAVNEGNDWESANSALCKKYSEYGLNNYQFMNPAYVVSLLYCLLVVPKELWRGKNREHEFYREIDADCKQNEAMSLFQTINSTKEDFETNKAYYLLAALRNSISHVNYEVDNDMNFKFWDISQKAASKRNAAEAKNEFTYAGNHFTCEVSGENLMKFLSIIGARLANGARSTE